MKEALQERLFTIGMKWRIAYGFLRVLVGLALLKIVGTPLIEVVTTVMRHELVDDPGDALYGFIAGVLAHHPLYITYFLALYFIFWGLVDMVLSYNLIKHNLWAFPASFVLIGFFIFYEALHFVHTRSLVLLWIICVDTVIVWLIWREYKKLKQAAAN